MLLCKLCLVGAGKNHRQSVACSSVSAALSTLCPQVSAAPVPQISRQGACGFIWIACSIESAVICYPCSPSCSPLSCYLATACTKGSCCNFRPSLLLDLCEGTLHDRQTRARYSCYTAVSLGGARRIFEDLPLTLPVNNALQEEAADPSDDRAHILS